MYKLILNGLTNTIDSVQKGNMTIPFDPQNRDYQAYLAWLEAGNTPLPADE